MSRILTLANALTYARLLLLPVIIVAVVQGRGWLATAAMLAVWGTDLVDGRLARRYGQAGALGKSLDSTVDFVLIYGLFIAFYAAGRLTGVQFAFLYLAMLSILTLQLLLGAAGGAEEVASTRLGKLTGAMQYAYLIFLVALEVLPPSELLWQIHATYFVALAAAIVLNTVECAVRIRRLVRAA